MTDAYAFVRSTRPDIFWRVVGIASVVEDEIKIAYPVDNEIARGLRLPAKVEQMVMAIVADAIRETTHE